MSLNFSYTNLTCVSVWAASSVYQIRQLTQKRPGHSKSELLLCPHPLKLRHERPELLELTQKRPELLEVVEVL
eukprot:12426653-Prorocentrum_lima.AAC.1